MGLLAQSKALDHRAILVRVFALQVIEELAALADHLEQAATRMEILDVRLEVLRQAVDALGEERNLDFGGAGVVSGALVLLYDLRFLRNLQTHLLLSLGSIGKAGILSDNPVD